MVLIKNSIEKNSLKSALAMLQLCEFVKTNEPCIDKRLPEYRSGSLLAMHG